MRRMLCLFGAVLFVACQQAPAPPAEEPPPPDPAAVAAAQVERGRYLVTIAGCHDCHTPKTMTDKGPEPDMSRALSGHPADAKLAEIPKAALGPGKWMLVSNEHLSAWAGPWGVSFTFNLTPHQATGLGSWTEEMFIKALRTGKHQGEGRDILPPMPWQMYRQMTDEDLKAVWAYLRSLPPIENAVPEPIAPAGPPPGAPAAPPASG
jgi:mono/diheme cytochrome c family protein